MAFRKNGKIEHIDEVLAGAKSWAGKLPIVIIDVDKCLISERGKIDDKLREFIKRYIEVGDDKEVLYEIEKGRIRPSKMLQDTLSSMLKGNQEFYMIDSQELVNI